ncbi:FAD-dependent oxidoreductase, partial [Sutterella sp.]|uniref:FAD-dependent oxidoreductase n=1 Tax=Sutterella sp. TaxID=1981025 RepID=UPI0026DF4E8D
MKLNRRAFLGSAAAAATVTMAPMGVAEAAVVEKKTDLVIVGGGLAGLAAGYAAVKKGLKPVILEKEAFLGGAGLFPEGSLGVGTRYQKEHGIKTTVQQVLDAALQFHHYRADPSVLRVLISESKDTIDEIMDMGVELRGIRTMYGPEESLMTWHLFKGGTAEVVTRFVKAIEAAGGEIRKQTSATKLIIERGCVAGVEAKDPKGTVIVRARKVIIATGGFAANREMLAQYVFDSSALGMVEPIWLRGPVVDGRTGDGINMARLVGAGVAGMHAVAGNAPYLPDVPPINQFSGPDELKQGRCALAQPWLWVDHTGRRFFNESRGSVFVDVYNAMTSAGGVSYTIFDQAKMDRMINQGAVLPFNAIVLAGVPLKALPKTWEIGMERGWAFKADTIEEL